MQHTKGPWDIRPCEGGTLGGYAIHGGGKTLAHVLANEDSPIAPMDQEAVANARLIAEAPRLLDIVSRLVRKLNRASEDGHNDLIRQLLTTEHLHYEAQDALEAVTGSRAPVCRD